MDGPALREDLRLFIVAGEASGDRLGAGLMTELRACWRGEVRFAGVGGPSMARLGLVSLFPYDDLAIMGLSAVLGRLGRLVAHLRRAQRGVAEFLPDAVVTVDVPGFSLRLARGLRRRGLAGPSTGCRLIHYGMPQSWAWNPAGARRFMRSYDLGMALFSFEVPWFAGDDGGMRCRHVGHPVVGFACGALEKRACAARFRAKHGLSGKGPALGVLFGSRPSEVAWLGKTFIGAAERFARAHPDTILVTVVAGQVRAEVEALLARSPRLARWVTVFDEGEHWDALAAMDLALAASGTIALELAARKVPMVVGYRANALNGLLARLLVRVPYANLINLMMDEPIVPEYMQGACRSSPLFDALAEIWEKDALRARQIRAMEQVMEDLGAGAQRAPARRAAEAVLETITASRIGNPQTQRPL